MNITHESEIQSFEKDERKEMINLLIFAKRELEKFYYGDQSNTLNKIREFLKKNLKNG